MTATTKTTKLVSIRLRHDEIEALKQRAASTGDATVTGFVRRLIRQELQRGAN